MLGGSSGINYLMYVRGSRNDYDGWRDLGNEGWGRDDLVPYFKKHQTLDLPSDKVKGLNAQLMPHAAADKFHGTNGISLNPARAVKLTMTSGPIHTSFNDFRIPMEEEFIKACYEVSKYKNTLHDAWSGDHFGFYSSLGAVDRIGNAGTRSYAATGYLKPNLGRPNLKVLTSALVSRILL
jgi:choline dehydrogenase-like flavoprotein